MYLEKPIVSVVVPIYEVAEYLERCIESIVKQSYTNLEVILVDDGAPDECAIICDDWAVKDNRITVIHQMNGGLSNARNHGMISLSGEYVGFIDSDDYVSEDFFEILLNTALKHNSDIVECSVAKFYESGGFEGIKDDSSVIDYSAVDGLSALIDENPFHQHVWNKLYKAEVVHGINFEVGKLNEDEFWTYQVFGRAKQVSRINKTLYYYFQRESSIMGQSYSLRRLDGLEGRWQRHLYIKKNYPSLTLQSKINFFGSCIFSYQCILKFLNGQDRRKGIAIVRKYKKNCGITFNEIIKMAEPSRKYYFLAKINLFLCSFLRNLIGAG